MKTTIKTIAAACLMLSLTITSCKKKDEATPTVATHTPTKTELLTGKNWKLTSSIVSPAFFGETDLYASMLSCEKDNITIFNSNGTVTDDQGATKCDPSDPQQSTTYNWSFNTDQTILTIDGDDGIIITLSTTTLKISVVIAYGGTNYTFTETYTKQ